MSKFFKVAMVACVSGAVLFGSSLANAADKEKKENPAAARKTEKPIAAKTKASVSKEKPTKQMTYLGVAVEPLHPAFWDQLEDVLEHKQGVMIAQVAKDSPADKAGLKPHDILMTFGDQKLFSPEQLAELVHADKSGQQVKLGVVREGKSEEINVTLGQHAVQRARRGPSPRRARQMHRFLSRKPGQQKSAWDRFDSISIKDLGKDRYKVEVGYETKDGKIKKRTFEGTREEIRGDINAQKDLPEDERDDLLRALNMQDENLDLGFGFPTLRVTPDGRVIWDLGRHNAPF